ncbi:MAG: hypothetical protein LRS43_01085 [Desulfurococcales archaeon]|nr:hypothetical protein [Desulfurococcales archaeon]
MSKGALGIILALLAGMGIGVAASGALQDILATIQVEIVEGVNGQDGNASIAGTITLNAGTLETGKTYSFDDVEGKTTLYTGGGGNFTFTLSYNQTAFQYVRVEIELSDGYEAEFYLDSNNPSQTLSLPGGYSIEVEVKLKEITVDSNAPLGQQEIQVLITGP